MDFKKYITARSIITFKKDFIASIIVFLVAIPLCIGIASACGLSPAAGLISGVIGGIIVGSFAGCPLQVSGPAAGLITIVWDTLQKHGIENFGAIILLAGVIQIIIGIFRLAPWFRAVSPAIIQGMLAGIGILILTSQFHVMLDHKPSSNIFTNIMSMPDAINKGLFPIDGSSHHLAAIIGIITLLILTLWHYVPARYKQLPATLVAVLFAIIIANIFQFPIKYIDISGNLLDAINLVSLDSIKHLLNHDALISAFSIAFIASAETLLSATAVDNLKLTAKTDYNKELLSQGLGNSVAGVLGVLPITGVIVRSAANVQAGAVSRLSSILHGFWILIFIVAFPFALAYIPTACLAAILIYTGFKLVNVPNAKTLFALSKAEFAIYIITIVSILATNLLEGILIGIAAGIIHQFLKLANFKIKVTKGEKTIIKMSGNLTFLRLPQIANTLESLEPKQNINIIFGKVNLIDHAIIDLLVGWSNRYMKRGGKVCIDWNHVKRIYPRFGWTKLSIMHPDIEKQTTPYILRDCAKCPYHYNSAEEKEV
jgi:MFS superfamily sulfate permease-like transporter